MCGRYQLQASADAIATTYGNTSWRPGHAARYNPRQQLRPTNHAPVLVAKGPASSCDAEGEDAEIVVMKWGMYPAWSSQQGRPPLINARRETLLQLPTFRNPLNRKGGSQRCAVPTTGFYEWHKDSGPGKPTLTPYLVQKSQETRNEDGTELATVTYMAGLYDYTGDSDGDEGSFVIITTEACKEYEWLHDRQPVFLSSENEVRHWLDTAITAADAVAKLGTESGLSWTRMEKDLSGPAKGKIMVQRGLDSFFAKKGSTKKEKDGKQKQTTPLPRETQKHSTGPLAPSGGIRKQSSTSKRAREKQKTRSSFS